LLTKFITDNILYIYSINSSAAEERSERG